MTPSGVEEPDTFFLPEGFEHIEENLVPLGTQVLIRITLGNPEKWIELRSTGSGAIELQSPDLLFTHQPSAHLLRIEL